jgi:formylglycine-generating enzyme required for sulfatase activity
MWRIFKEVTSRDRMLRNVFRAVRTRNALRGDRPVTSIVWDEARQYAEIIGMRLPTEAEWEWAAKWAARVWWERKRRNELTQGGFTNPFEQFYMLGSVLQWVSDWYGPYEPAHQTDPKGPNFGESRILRGGSRMPSTRYKSPQDARERDIGFRCVAGSL